MSEKPISFKRKILRVVTYYLLIHLLFFTVSGLINLPILKIFSLQSILETDGSFNDLYYQMRDTMYQNSARLSNKLVLVNTGSLKRDSFRLELANLVKKISNLNPKVVAIDHDFNKDTSIPGTRQLIETINQTENIILGKKDTVYLNFTYNVKFANVGFPEKQVTIRSYYSDTLTFAYQISKKITDKEITPLKNETFFLNYIAYHNDLVTRESGDMFDFFSMSEKQSSFLMIEADDILRNDSIVIDKLKDTKDLAFLLGYLGNSKNYDPKYDIEDKFRVPYQKLGTDRDRVMPGILIHANAVENIINTENRFYCLSQNIFFIIIQQFLIILFIYYILFNNKGKFFNVILLVFLTFPLIYFVCYLMTKNIYIEIGLTLLSFLVIEE
ncbi:MAG: CHASE2 domain-containing protein, partial [Bacteroidota bacterium]